MVIFHRLEPLAFAVPALLVTWGAGIHNAPVNMFLWIGAGVLLPALYVLFSTHAETKNEFDVKKVHPYIRWGILFAVIAVVLIGAEWDWASRVIMILSVAILFLRLIKPFTFASTPVLDGLSAVVFAMPFMLAWWPYRDHIPETGALWAVTAALAAWFVGMWWWSGLFSKKEDEEAERYTTAVAFGYTKTNRMAWLAFVVSVGCAIYAGAWLLALGLFGFVLGCYVLSPESKIHATHVARMYAFVFAVAITFGMSILMEWYVYAQYMWYHIATVATFLVVFLLRRFRT